MKQEFPCYGCAERHEGCRAECARYRTADRQRRTECQKRYRDGKKESDIISHMMEQSWKRKKRYKKP